jgi:LmbE family N-acetylglucosaminyl deacetylase
VNVLAVGAHPDDVELGCGGALLGHAAQGDHVTILVMTDGGRALLDDMSRQMEQQTAACVLDADLIWGGFDDGFVPEGPESISVIDDALARTGAGILYTHAPDDTHQDHRATASASLAAGRKLSTILQYETPSTRHFDPSVFVDVEASLDDKLRALRSHMSQVLRHGPVDLEVIEAQARFRGSQGRVAAAEGFEVARLAWDLSPAAAIAPVVSLEVVRSARGDGLRARR